MKKIVLILNLFLIISCNSDNNNPCPIFPNGLNTIIIGNTTTKVVWSIESDVESFEIVYGKLGFDREQGTKIEVTEQQYTIENLKPETTYTCYVRAICQESQAFSEWSEPHSFLTLKSNPLCDPPRSFGVALNRKSYAPEDPITTHHKIFVGWAGGSFDGLEIQYGLKNFKLGEGTIITTQNYPTRRDGQQPIDGFEPETEYDFYIRNICPKAGLSDWQGPESVKTSEVPFNIYCVEPENFDTGPSNLDGYVNFTWDENFEASWDVLVIPTGSPIISDSSNTYTVNDNSFRLQFNSKNGFVDGDKYDFYVRANCGSNGGSDWIGPLTYEASWDF